MAPHFFDMLFKTPKNKEQAKKNLGLLWDLIRKHPTISLDLGLAPPLKRGRHTLAETAHDEDYFLVLAVRAGIKKADLLRHLFKEQKPEDRLYRWLRRLEKAFGPECPPPLIDKLKRVDYKTRLELLKPFLSRSDSLT